jgi:HK97 family phage portal protein
LPALNPLVRLFPFLDRKSWTFAPPDFTLSFFGSAKTITGATINPDTAMRIAPVNAAVRLISTACGLTPAKVYSREPKAPAGGHTGYRLVNGFANEWTSAGEFREVLTADAMLRGHGYARAIRVNGKVREFHRLDQRLTPVQRKFRARDGEPFYIVGSGADAIEVPYTDMLHLPGFYDLSIVVAGKEAIGLASYLETKAAKFVAKHAQPSGLVFFDKSLTRKRKIAEDGEREESMIPNMRAAWDQAIANDASGTLFIDDAAGARYQAVPTPSAQAAELVAQREFQIAEVSRLTGVPPTMLSSLGRATWSNVEQLGLQFRQDALRPWLRRWEDAYARVLLTPDERDEFFVEFILDDLAAADVKTQAEAFAKYRAAGVMTANEVRAVRNLPANADGDTLANPYTTSNAAEAA